MVNDQVKPVSGGVGPADSGFERVRPVADAILYEGYLLYPYRRSSPKNRVRWQFGVLAPRVWAERNGPVAPGIAGSVESWRQHTECLLEAADDAVVHVRLRYLQLQQKALERRMEDGRYVAAQSLDVAGTVHLAFDEAVARETDIVVPLADLCSADREFPVGVPGSEEVEEIAGGAGRVVRRRHAIEAVAALGAERLDGSRGLYRLRVHTENTGQGAGADTPRDEALRHALIATHTFLGGDGVAYLSLTDPPQWAEGHARDCRNIHTFPVPAGEEGSRDLMLSSPIILSDHPQVAPESPGDLYDAAEIDEILSLRTLLLTDEEKREARATDQRAAQILERVDGMTPETFARLHGAIRSLEPAPLPGQQESDPKPRASTPWWEEGGDDGLCPATDSVLIDGVAVAKGSRVRLCPRERGADAHDMFLTGRPAQVAAVFHDVDGTVRLAVTLEDDPAAELHAWYGRFFYFRPDEVRPLATASDEERSDGCHRAVEA